MGYTIDFVSESSGIVTTDWRDEHSGFDRFISGRGMTYKMTGKIYSISEGFNIDISLQTKGLDWGYWGKKSHQKIMDALVEKLKYHVVPDNVKLITR